MTINLAQLLRRLVFVLPFAIVLPFGTEIGPVNVALPDILIVLLVVLAWAIRTRDSGAGRLHLRLDHVLVFAMAFIVMASAVAAGSLGGNLIQVVRFFEAAFLVYVVDKIIATTRITPDWLFRSLKLTGVVGSIYSILQATTGIGRLFVARNEFNEIRTAGLAHGGAFGAILMTGLLLAVIDFLDGKRSQRMINLLWITIIGVGMLFTQTRAWFLATLVAIVIYILLSRSRQVILVTVMSPLIAAALWFGLFYLGGFGLLFGSYADVVAGRFAQVTDLVTGNVRETSINSRLMTWELGVDKFRSSPILGVGPGGLSLEAPTRRDLIFTKSDSQWVDFLAQYGILGISVFVVMVVGLIIRQVRLLRDPDPVVVASAKKYLVIYSGWMFGAFFWSITTGYMLLYFAFVSTVGMRAWRNVRRYPAAQRTVAQPSPKMVGRNLAT